MELDRARANVWLVPAVQQRNHIANAAGIFGQRDAAVVQAFDMRLQPVKQQQESERRRQAHLVVPGEQKHAYEERCIKHLENRMNEAGENVQADLRASHLFGRAGEAPLLARLLAEGADDTHAIENFYGSFRQALVGGYGRHARAARQPREPAYDRIDQDHAHGHGECELP